ncbi:hypothetical protein [Methanobrevibacter filiformis]|uniref:Uncharacterized protein n=1 Tax=Methanobrevibacter filiformis TaxID=55758 RepID=A0A166BKZ7_9EURY|nr:hypothetical protein [Methanobrevibacter filiformis]KZX13506.1 hypothetical protein MBFIL_10280 [Methanobrevibacter filiformis]
MFLKIRRDTLIILLLAFVLILSGRLITYIAFASSPEIEDGVVVAGVIIKGNDIVPIDSIRANIANSGLRSGSSIKNGMLITTKRSMPLSEAITNAQNFATLTTVPGTKLQPIAAADVKIDESTGIVTVNVIEDFSTIDMHNLTAKNALLREG